MESSLLAGGRLLATPSSVSRSDFPRALASSAPLFISRKALRYRIEFCWSGPLRMKARVRGHLSFGCNQLCVAKEATRRTAKTRQNRLDRWETLVSCYVFLLNDHFCKVSKSFCEHHEFIQFLVGFSNTCGPQCCNDVRHGPVTKEMFSKAQRLFSWHSSDAECYIARSTKDPERRQQNGAQSARVGVSLRIGCVAERLDGAIFGAASASLQPFVVGRLHLS